MQRELFHSQRELVDHLIRLQTLKSKELIEVFYLVDRADFVTDGVKAEAYGDYALPLFDSQTISQPYTVAFMLELLQPEAGQKMLDIGFGSGWTTTMLAMIAGDGGKVWATEIRDSLFEFGKANIARYGFSNVNAQKAGLKLGVEGEKFDKILVSAAAGAFPMELLSQVNESGTIVIPINNSIVKVEKITGDGFASQEYPGFSFVPLVH